MLSFLKDERNKNAATPADQPAQPVAPESADGQVSREEDFLVPTEHGKNTKQSTLVLIALFAVGALCVWFMIKKSTPNSANAAPNPEEEKIAKAMVELTGIQDIFNKAKVEDIVGRFTQISAVDQVNVAELKKNPFRRDLVLGAAEPPAPNAADQESVRKEEIKRQAGKLQLLSIMNSDKGDCCMINDKILNVGQAVDGFIVSKITPDAVELTNNGVTIQLKMVP
jgi:hypothetical protein